MSCLFGVIGSYAFAACLKMKASPAPKRGNPTHAIRLSHFLKTTCDIKYFQKTIALDPHRSDAYFEQGISYGQLGNFVKAIVLINQAIEMNPHNGLYYYGRARVNLLAGEKEKAMADFIKAAELDDEDAQNYLKIFAKTH